MRYTKIGLHSIEFPTTSHTPTHVNRHPHTLKKKKPNPPSIREKAHIVDSQPPWLWDKDKLPGGSLDINSEWKNMSEQMSAVSDETCTVTFSLQAQK